MISSTFLNKIASFIQSKISKVDYTLNGVNKSASLSSITTTSNTVKLAIMLDENVEGTITQFKIIDTENEVIKTEDCNLIKSKGRGYYKSFTLSISEVI